MGKFVQPEEAGPDKQSNKRHNKPKAKLVAKKKYKKNKQKYALIRSKLRDIKRNKDIYLKMNVVSERFSHKVHCDEIYVLQ